MSRRADSPLKYEPDYAVAPGETLAERLAELDMDQRDLSARLEMAPKTVNQIIRGKAPITHETAIKLERVTGVPAHVWNNLEMNYRAALARMEDQARTMTPEDRQWLKTIPVSELVKRGRIEQLDGEVALLLGVLKFFGVSSRQAWQGVWNEPKAAWRTSTCFASDPGATATWLRLGELDAQEIRCKPFDRAKFLETLDEIRKLTTADPKAFQPKMIELCAQAGVAVVFVPEIKGCRASGAARWLTPDKALIQLSLRYRTDDHFWFSFFHEAGHVLNDPKKAVTIDGPNEDGGQSEQQANRFSADFLIPPDDAAELPGLQTVRAVRVFARRIGIAPGIVVGRLQKEGIVPYSWLNDLKAKFVWATD